MSTMPGRVTKTPAFESFDSHVYADLKAFEEKYGKPPQIDDLLEDAVQRGIITDGTRQHVRADWLQLYWPKATHANRILQRGLYWAVRLARYIDGDDTKGERKAALPLCSVWICTGEYGDPRFEVVSLVSEHQVTVIFLTPPPEKDLSLPSGLAMQPIWSTRCEAFPEVPGERLIDTWYQTVTVRPLNPAQPE